VNTHRVNLYGMAQHHSDQWHAALLSGAAPGVVALGGPFQLHGTEPGAPEKCLV